MVVEPGGSGLDVEAINDRLALEHPSDEYYARAPWPIRLVEKRRLAIVRSFVGEAEGEEVAEIGSGGGHVLRMFPRAHLTAIDVSDVYLDQARQNLAGYDVTFVKGEVDKMDLPDASFDRIICTEVLEHVTDPDAILRTIARLLRPAGVAAITVPNDPLILRIKRVVKRPPMRWLLGKVEWGGDEYHLHRWTPREFEDLLSGHLRVRERRFAPSRVLPLRSCFRCVAKRRGAADFVVR
ncbi:MAG: class I SAM-dependent methyltransferase [Candidatus Rokuibacteriota bacterium]|nr:MAG: class I SAM-dependent methyltransferase [Candidatus Rokubacteria bacterium]